MISTLYVARWARSLEKFVGGERIEKNEKEARLKKGLRSNLFHVPARYIKRSTSKTPGKVGKC